MTPDPFLVRGLGLGTGLEWASDVLNMDVLGSTLLAVGDTFVDIMYTLSPPSCPSADTWTLPLEVLLGKMVCFCIITRRYPVSMWFSQ